MAGDSMDLDYAAMDELGADVADLQVGCDRDGNLHLPGMDVLLLGGMPPPRRSSRACGPLCSKAGRTSERPSGRALSPEARYHLTRGAPGRTE